MAGQNKDKLLDFGDVKNGCHSPKNVANVLEKNEQATENLVEQFLGNDIRNQVSSPNDSQNSDDLLENIQPVSKWETLNSSPLVMPSSISNNCEAEIPIIELSSNDSSQFVDRELPNIPGHVIHESKMSHNLRETDKKGEKEMGKKSSPSHKRVEVNTNFKSSNNPVPNPRQTKVETSRITTLRTTSVSAKSIPKTPTNTPRSSQQNSGTTTPKNDRNECSAHHFSLPHAKLNSPTPNKKNLNGISGKKLGEIRSKIGSLDNATHCPGGGRVKIESKKQNFSEKAKPKIASIDNLEHKSTGGTKRILSQKLEWKAASKVGSLANVTHKPTESRVKVFSEKLDFSSKVESKIGSLENAGHSPQGGNVKSKADYSSTKSKINSKDKV